MGLMPDEPVHELTNEQQELNEAKTLREQARARREQQEEETTARRMEQKRIESSQILIERLAESRGAMHRALAPFQLSAAGERGELSRKITYGFTKVLGDVLLDLREMGVLKKLEEVHDTAILAHYRQEQDDPEQVRIAYEYAKRIIQTDPTDHEHLLELVRYAEEEPALQKAWDWVQILLNGLTGKQWLVWKEKQPVGHLPDTEVASAKPG